MEKLWRCPIRGGNWFLSVPSARRATQEERAGLTYGAYFYPRPPRGGRPSFTTCWSVQENFYPRPPRGGRRADAPFQKKSTAFLSTPSARRATARQFLINLFGEISIHALREEGDRQHINNVLLAIISIHALREEGDRQHINNVLLAIISIHALREEGDATVPHKETKTTEFLSTPSARRATSRPSPVRLSRMISIHALREEGDRTARMPAAGF